MQDFYLKNKQAVQNSLILCGGVLACFLFFRYLFPIFLPFVFGWLLSLMFTPLADRLEKLHVPRWLGALLGIVLLISAIGFLGYFAGNQLYEQMHNLVNDIPFYLKKMEEGLTLFWARVDEMLIGLPDVVANVTAYLQDELFNILFALVQGSGSVSAITAVPKVLLGCFIALFSSYFLTKDKDAIRLAYKTHIEPLFGESLAATKKDLLSSLWGYVKTQLILMVYIFLVCIVGLYAIGYLIIYGVVQIVRQFMQPKILGSQLGMHPLLTLFAMYFGYKCIGFWGLILGPIVAVILRAILRIRQQNRAKLA